MSKETFEARFPGKCPDCQDPIEVGDEVMYAGNKLVHADPACSGIGTVVSGGQKPFIGDVCHKCWTVYSVSGACGCID